MAKAGQKFGDLGVAACPVGDHERDAALLKRFHRRVGVDGNARIHLASDAPGGGRIDEDRPSRRHQFVKRFFGKRHGFDAFFYRGFGHGEGFLHETEPRQRGAKEQQKQNQHEDAP